MAVLFQPPSSSHILRANKPAELLQGFLNIQTAENVNSGKLTQAHLNSYSQKQFFAADPNGDVAGYLKSNFGQIAKLDGDAASISTDDLVQLRQGLPTPPVSKPPIQQPPPVDAKGFMSLLLNLFQMMIQMMSGQAAR